jgi:hypothetical protein
MTIRMTTNNVGLSLGLKMTTDETSILQMRCQTATMISPKQETPKKGHARARLVPFGTDPHKWCLLRVHAFLTIYALAKMAQKKFRKLPSAARFFPKRF